MSGPKAKQRITVSKLDGGTIVTEFELRPFTKAQKRRIERVREWERRSEERIGLHPRRDDEPRG